MYLEKEYNFGAVQLPVGYKVVWRQSHEHYQAVGPDEWEGEISVDPYWCRKQAIWHSKWHSKEGCLQKKMRDKDMIGWGRF